MAIVAWFVGRVRHLWTLLSWSARALNVMIWTLGLVDLWLAQGIPKEEQDAIPRFYEFLPGLDLSTWVAIGLALLFFAVWEASYKRSSRLENIVEQTQNQLADIKESPASVAYRKRRERVDSWREQLGAYQAALNAREEVGPIYRQSWYTEMRPHLSDDVKMVIEDPVRIYSVLTAGYTETDMDLMRNELARIEEEWEGRFRQ